MYVFCFRVAATPAPIYHAFSTLTPFYESFLDEKRLWTKIAIIISIQKNLKMDKAN